MNIILTALLLFGCTLGAASAQSVQRLAFEVASIRPHNPDLPGPTMKIPARGEISIVGMTVRELIRFAYNVQEDYRLAAAPKWIDSAKYDIRAKGPEPSGGPARGGSALDLQRVRMQQLLADRFALKLHHETRQSKVYFLNVAKTGLKMQRTSGTDPKARDKGSIIPWNLIPLELSRRIGAPVVDKTNLSGS